MSNIIFDFDGTLADSLPVVTDLFNQWFRSNNPLTLEEVAKLRNMNARQASRELNISIWQVPGLLVKGRKAVGRRLHEIPMHGGIESVIKNLHKDGHRLFVVSSNSPENIRKFLKAHNVYQYLSGLQGNAGLFGKTAVLKSVMRKYHLASSDTYYIADEVRDVDAAKKANVKSVAVSWGYNGYKILKAQNPSFLLSDPSQIIALFK